MLTQRYFVAMLLVVVGVVARAQTATVEPSTALLNASRAIAVNAKTGKLYEVKTRSGTVSVTDIAKNKELGVPVGKEPMALAINETTNRIYVANNAGGTVSVIDGASDAVVATVDVGALPYVLAVNPTTNKVFVSNTFSDAITLIDGATNATTKIKAGSADTIVVDAKLDRAYLTGWEGTSLTVLDSKPSIVAKVRMGGMHLWGVAVDEAAGKVYATRAGAAQLAIVYEASGSVTNIATGAIPCAVAVNSATNRVYVVNHGDDSVTVVDAAMREVIATVKVGSLPQGIAVDTKANRIYVANVHGDSISVIDGSSNRVVKTLSTGKNPYAIAVDPNGGRMFVALLGAPGSGN